MLTPTQFQLAFPSLTLPTVSEGGKFIMLSLRMREEDGWGS